MDVHNKKLCETNAKDRRKHRLVHDYELPAALHRPLVFGDRDQINALSCLDERIKREASKAAKIASGNINTYSVTLAYSTTERIQVIAVDKEDAEEKAIALSEQNGSCFEEVEVKRVDVIKRK